MYKVYGHLDKVGDFMVDEDLDKIIEIIGLDSNEYNYYVTIYDFKTDKKVAEGRGKNLCKIK